MSTPGSRAMSIGITIMLLSVGAGIHSGGFGLLLCFAGVLAGANLVMASCAVSPAPTSPDGARALAAAFMRRNTAIVGLVMASCAVTVVSGKAEDPVLCFGIFALLVLGVSLIIVGAHGE